VNHTIATKEKTVRNRLPALSFLLASTLLSQQACAEQVTPTTGASQASSKSGLDSPAPAVPSASPAATASTSAPPAKSQPNGVLAGNRQVWILPKVSEATVAVDKSLDAGLSDDFGDRALFVLTPSAGRYQIKTAKLRVNDDPAGETYCLAVKGTKVVATGCDAADSKQLFHVIKSGKSGSDKQLYVIRTEDYSFLRVADMSSNLTASKIEEGAADAGTDFLLPDKGKASLPTLD
jgi:hypothetical protein